MCKILHDCYYSLKDYENSLERDFLADTIYQLM